MVLLMLSIDESRCDGFEVVLDLFFQLILVLQNVLQFVVVFTGVVLLQLLQQSLLLDNQVLHLFCLEILVEVTF